VRTALRQAIILAVLLVAGRAAAAPLPPRYKLTVGSRLLYSSTSESKYSRSARGLERTTEVRVVGQNEDRSWRLVLRHTSASYRVDSTNARTEDEQQTEWTCCDLTADGKVGRVASTGALDPARLFVQLPAYDLEGEQKWERFDAKNSEWTRYTYGPGPADNIRLVRADYETPLDPIYLTSAYATFEFNIETGLVTRCEAVSERNWGAAAGRTATVTTLDSVTSIDSTQAQAFESDLVTFLEADSVSRALLDRAIEDPGRKQALFDSARAVMDSGRAQVTDMTVQAMFDEEIGMTADVELQIEKDAAWRESLIGRPAPAWSLLDLDGTKRALKDYRGRVIILDFWYRGCPWCIRAMPELNGLAREYLGRPVEFIGMNVDRDTADARFVVAKLGLGYTSVQARGEDKNYRVQGYPTLYVIDGKGIIRDIRVGYSADLAAKLRATIGRLLAGEK